MNAAELTIKEIQDAEVQLRWNAEEKHEKIGTSLIELFALPTPAEVARTPMMAALCWMIWLDLKRPFQVSWLRLRAAGFVAWLVSLFGIFPTRKSGTGTCHSNRAKAGVAVQANSVLVPHQTGFQSVARHSPPV